MLYVHNFVHNLYILITNVHTNSVWFPTEPQKNLLWSNLIGCGSFPTLLTCEQLAILLMGSPMLGHQATSLTQSVWASSFSSNTQLSLSSLHIFGGDGHHTDRRTHKCIFTCTNYFLCYTRFAIHVPQLSCMRCTVKCTSLN